MVDPHWNPQLEAQAQDRVYRVGQKKPVKIYRQVDCDMSFLSCELFTLTADFSTHLQIVVR